MVIVQYVLQYFIAAVLFATTLGKLLDVPGFVRVLKTYRSLPQWALRPAAAGTRARRVISRGVVSRRPGAGVGRARLGRAACRFHSVVGGHVITKDRCTELRLFRRVLRASPDLADSRGGCIHADRICGALCPCDPRRLITFGALKSL